MADKELTILIPCLQEAETIGLCISKAFTFLERCGIDGEVLVADNGSTDKSPSIARVFGARVMHVPQRGYGSTIRGGISAARGRYIIMGDADNTYDFSKIEGFVDKLRSGADLVIGNRFKGGIEPRAMPLTHRYFGNPALSYLGRLLFRTHVGDFHCGLRAFKTERIRSLKLESTGMELASEMVVRAVLAGYHIEEVPTTLEHGRRTGQSHLRTWRDGWRHLQLLLVYRWKGAR
jgi:glycosyltransferase involved in cell wall biosynthesis